MRRLVVAVMFAAACVWLQSGEAAADTSGSIVTDNSGAVVSAGSNSSAPGGGGGGSSDPNCTYVAFEVPDGAVMHQADGSPIEVDGTGQWYEKWCGQNFVGAFYISAVDPRDLLAEARSRLDLPLPVAGLSPTGEQLVNLETWLWVDPEQWQTLSASASVPGLTVTVFATPERARWSMGDGTVVDCGAGTPYDANRPAIGQATDCGHVYGRSSIGQPGAAYQASLTVQWRLTWSINGGALNPIGTIDRTTAFAVAVAEIQAVNVESRGTP